MNKHKILDAIARSPKNQTGVLLARTISNYKQIVAL